MNLYETLEKHLQGYPDFVENNGEMKKWVVLQNAQNNDTKIIKALLDNSKLKKKFFTDIEGTLVFKRDEFINFLEYKNYLNDSYTKYKTKIGLTIDGKYLNKRNEVELVWPYKDCILEGGQSDEEATREEIFFNETLAQDEITQLLEPKVMTNVKVFNENRKSQFKGFNRDANINKRRNLPEDTITDNLIIKGNNLLALHSIKKQFTGKVKLIYIDPPYNTGNDSFKYNDSFNHASWLTFMRNRLEVAHTLLRDDGIIFVQCDDNEQARLKVIMDELFREDNFVANFIWNHRKSSQNDIDVSLSHNYTITFAKNRDCLKLQPLGIDESKFSNPDNDSRGDWVADPFDAPNIRPNLTYPVINPNTGEEFLPPQGRHWRFTKNKFEEALRDKRIIFGKTGKTKPQYKRFKYEAEEKGTNPFTIWDGNEVGTATEGTKELMKLMDGKKVFSTPKPERLLQRIIHIGSNKNDIILDFHLGSGTTAAVAHKMGRQYIGVEQMDYIEGIACKRLKKVIKGEEGGVSKDVNWKGGSTFIYLELKKYNQNFIEKIENTKTTEKLLKVWQEMKGKSFINYNVDIKKQDADIEVFKSFAIEKQKRILCKILDKNQLYVNLSSLDDKDFKCTKDEQKVTNNFYNINDEK